MSSDNKTKVAHQSPFVRMLRRVLRARMAGFGLIVAALVVLAAIFAPWISPYHPFDSDAYATLAAPSSQHWLGTDDLGRDVLSRLVHGARISMIVAFGSILMAALVGTAIGLIAGYAGRLVDEILMRAMDAVLAFPAILLALGITAVLGLGITNVIIALAIVNTPTLARLVRGEVLTVREQEFVLAARSLGFGRLRILLRHILPTVAPVLVVQATIMMSHAIIAEASLSFLGVGAAAPAPSWGAILNSGFNYLEKAPWLWLAPGVTIFTTVFAMNMVGDGLRFAVDPRSED